MPSLALHDLTGPGITLPSPMAVDPPVLGLLEPDRPHGLDQAPDPLLPDLSSPTLTQQVHMPARPAELSDQALTIMHQTPTYQQIPADDMELSVISLSRMATWMVAGCCTGLGRQD